MRGRRGRAGWWGASAMLVGALLAGCSRDDGRPPVFPVRGQVTFKGKPAAGAFVVFHPLDRPAPGEQRPSATVKPDGTFELTSHGATRGGDGAPAGTYAVTVEWYRLVGTGNDLAPGPNVIPPSYTKPETTPIKVAVAAGENNLEPIAVK
jgi:hypothetical protein